MKKPLSLVLLIWTAASWLRSGTILAASATPELEDFEKNIRPILVEHCYECHSATSSKLKGGLRVDDRESLLKGGDTGPAIVPGKPESSLLLKAISHIDPDLAMPPKKPKLATSVIDHFEHWIRAGAAWPEESAKGTTSKPKGFDIQDRKQQLPWVWHSPKRPPLPEVKDAKWPTSEVDRFILARLEKEGLKPGASAEPEVWLRRVYFALIGLPPSPDELEAFLKDPSASAREWVVDRLLNSPQYGERWARHWLDLMRYAESRGHESDYVIPNAYEYRDYVIRALNADLPYNAFVEEHIAGDLLPQPRLNQEKGFNESILATGWAFLGEEIHAPVDTRQDENERTDNRIDVMSKAFLGLTVSCARCHDHKFDAISQKDYYALAGYFLSTSPRLVRYETMESERNTAQALERLTSEWTPKINSQLPGAESEILSKLKDYLFAASKAAEGETNSLPKPGARLASSAIPSPIVAKICRLAVESGLDTNTLRHWTAALLSAGNQDQDPLSPIAMLALGKPSVAIKPVAESPELSLPKGARMVTDFSKLSPSEWIADGVAFGLKPLQAGDCMVGLAPGAWNPSLHIASRAGAYLRPDWRELDLSPGVEREPTLFGSWKRDGVMLRSPKFELTHGKLYYLVRGSGRILAAVDSQRLVTGPVHTVQVREWSFSDSWRWISHDLSDYTGHRVAIEFSPGNEFDTAIACIVESETQPQDPMSASQWLARAVQSAKTQTIEEAASAYQACFSKAASASNGSTSDGALELRSWMAARPELFTGKEGDWGEPLNQVLRGYQKEHEPLFAQMQWRSKTAPAMLEGNGVDEYLLARGKHQSPKGLVARRFLEALEPLPIANESHGSGRRQLAEAMTDPSNPLLSRVMVNRVWHHLFGRGLVASVDNFGWLGQRPSHPELLDDLSVTFVQEDHWSLKRLIRRLVLSRTFALSSKPGSTDAESKDPDNILLHRMNLLRLEGESIRDAMLKISGRLDLKMYGPSVPLHPSQFVEARGLRSERGPLDGDGRRSLYLAARRNFLPMMMTAFDTPTPFTTVGRRNVSNVPGQMLFLMNDPFVHQQAEVWAKRLLSDLPDATPEERIQRLFQAALSRTPNPAEIQRCQTLLAEAKSSDDAESGSMRSWSELCHAMFGVKEFIYVR